ncbi:MAG: homoserine kinase [Acidobacteria bacterium]|nr:homoserine kinase [Acidobacteriota bacterium]MBV9626040.1 homoserine kinase [Acidobacteriota bacterium]
MTEFTITLPATSANLGPAFDAAAMALKLSVRLRARRAREFSITATGRDQEICGRLDNHLIISTYQEVLAAERRPVPALALQIENGFPVAKGCGSSAAARLAGIALAVHFGRLRWTSARIIGEASAREHHPDNAAACWLGGVTVARMRGHLEAQVARFVPKGEWPLMLAIPDNTLATETARAVLPNQYSRADTVANIQNSMLLVAALFQGNHDLLASSLDDRLHQPWRGKLCPLLPALAELGVDDGVLGVALSGAGPSVLIFLDPRLPPAKRRGRIEAKLKKRGLRAELVPTAIARRGAEASFLRRVG